jgi:Recombination endonuclease VII
MTDAATQRAYRKAHPERVRATQKRARDKWRAANPEEYARNKRNGTLKQYGLTIETFDALFVAQGSCCAICWSTDPRAPNWHVDHDKTKTKRDVRGILCGPCNMALGLFNHDAGDLTLAAIYLQKHDDGAWFNAPRKG